MQVKMLTVATILQYISTKKKMEDLNRWVHTLPIIRGYVSNIFEKLMVIFIIAAVPLDIVICISISCAT